jgi:hypothetical protein
LRATFCYRYNMVAEARYAAPETPGTPTNAKSGHSLAPEELAEFLDSLREDEVLSPTGDSDDFDPAYND